MVFVRSEIRIFMMTFIFAYSILTIVSGPGWRWDGVRWGGWGKWTVWVMRCSVFRVLCAKIKGMLIIYFEWDSFRERSMFNVLMKGTAVTLQPHDKTLSGSATLSNADRILLGWKIFAPSLRHFVFHKNEDPPHNSTNRTLHATWIWSCHGLHSPLAARFLEDCVLFDQRRLNQRSRILIEQLKYIPIGFNLWNLLPNFLKYRFGFW